MNKTCPARMGWFQPPPPIEKTTIENHESGFSVGSENFIGSESYLSKINTIFLQENPFSLGEKIFNWTLQFLKHFTLQDTTFFYASIPFLVGLAFFFFKTEFH